MNKTDTYTNTHPDTMYPVSYTRPETQNFFWSGSTYKRETPKIGHNQQCPCGSGKKYKKCCGGNNDQI